MENNKRNLTTLKDLTKSKLKDFETCPTMFYLSEYHKELKQATDEKTQATFDNGRYIENLARISFCLSNPLFTSILEVFPTVKTALSEIIGKQIKDQSTINEVLTKNEQSLDSSDFIVKAMDLVVEVLDKDNAGKRNSTMEFLAQGKVIIYEASFKGEGLTHIQADILAKNFDGSFDAVEIKSGGSKKAIEEYSLDVSIQFNVLNRIPEIKVNKVHLWAINSEGTQENLFISFDMNEIAIANTQTVLDLEQKAFEVQQQLTMPKPVFKTECSSCPFFETVCGKHTVNNPKSVIHLPNFRAKYALLNEGISEVNESFLEKPPVFATQKAEKEFLKANKHIDYTIKNREIVESVLNNKQYLNVEGLKADLATWKFPLRFFDFEAYMASMPLFASTRPYETVVTQFSCHLLTSPRGELTHSEWLHETLANPRTESVNQIIKALGTDGSIVSYNQTYEKTQIKNLIKLFPEFTNELTAIVDRFVDLKDLIEAHVYDPQFFGSFGLKVVSPVLLSIENGCYNDVELKSGANYNPAYLELVTTSLSSRKNHLSTDIRKYCYYDTLNLYLIYQWILNTIAEHESANEGVKHGA